MPSSKTGLAMLALSCAMVSAFAPQSAEAYDVCADSDRCTHEEFTSYGVDVFNALSPVDITDSTSRLIQYGAGHEDEVDHGYGYGGDFVTVTHFWNADNLDWDAPSGIPFINGDEPNSWQKVRQYWMRALGEAAWAAPEICINRPGVSCITVTRQGAYHFLGHVAHHLEDNTVPTHAHVDAHDPFSGDDSYEDWMSQGAETDLGTQETAPDQPPGSNLLDGEFGILSQPYYGGSAGGLDPLLAMDFEQPLPDGNAHGAVETPLDRLYWLLYTTNQIADAFPSDDDSEPPIPFLSNLQDPEGWIATELGVIGGISSPRVPDDLDNNDCHEDFFGGCGSGTIGDYDNNHYDNDLGVIREYSYLRGIRAVAGLVHLYEQTVETEIISVNVRGIHITDGDCDDATFAPACEAYVRVGIGARGKNYLQGRNEGDAWEVGEDESISPSNWIWGNTVADSEYTDTLDGRQKVLIDVYVMDDDLDTEGLQSDDRIDVGAGFTLAAHLKVDLEKCRRRQPGAVEISELVPLYIPLGACGEYLISSNGDGKDYSGTAGGSVAFTVEITDVVPPEIYCDSADGQWHADDVQIGCDWKDAYTGQQGSFKLSTNVPIGTETDNAATGTQEVCDWFGNCATAGPVTGNHIDKKAPAISIVQPTATEYVHSATLVLDYSVTDGGSGVGTVLPTMNGDDTVAGHGLLSGQAIHLLTELPLGLHTFQVDADDNVGNVSTPESVTFSIIVTPESIIEAVDQLEESGAIDSKIVRSLMAKLGNGQKKWNKGQCGPAENIYQALINEVEAQSGKKITPVAAHILIADAEYLIEHCAD